MEKTVKIVICGYENIYERWWALWADRSYPLADIGVYKAGGTPSQA